MRTANVKLCFESNLQSLGTISLLAHGRMRQPQDEVDRSADKFDKTKAVHDPSPLPFS